MHFRTENRSSLKRLPSHLAEARSFRFGISTAQCTGAADQDNVPLPPQDASSTLTRSCVVWLVSALVQFCLQKIPRLKPRDGSVTTVTSGCSTCIWGGDVGVAHDPLLPHPAAAAESIIDVMLISCCSQLRVSRFYELGTWGPDNELLPAQELWGTPDHKSDGKSDEMPEHPKKTLPLTV